MSDLVQAILFVQVTLFILITLAVYSWATTEANTRFYFKGAQLQKEFLSTKTSV